MKKKITIFRAVGLIGLNQKIQVKQDNKTIEKTIEYTGGSVSDQNVIEGRYISKDAAITEAIKASKRFKDGRIKIESETEEEVADGAGVKDNPTPPNPNPNGGTDPNADPTKVSEATNQQQAKEFLKSKGEDAATVDAMTTNAQVIEFAKPKGYSFPKWEAFNK